jgi:hypothetical protein
MVLWYNLGINGSGFVNLKNPNIRAKSWRALYSRRDDNDEKSIDYIQKDREAGNTV